MNWYLIQKYHLVERADLSKMGGSFDPVLRRFLEGPHTVLFVGTMEMPTAATADFLKNARLGLFRSEMKS